MKNKKQKSKETKIEEPEKEHTPKSNIMPIQSIQTTHRI